MTSPSIDQLRSLPATMDLTVPAESIDENGHMNITKYFELGAWAPWVRLQQVAVGEDYIGERGNSFFTVEHRIRYLGELRLDEPFSVRAAFAGRTEKALHGISFVVDESRDRLACVMEEVYVHVSMESRRSTPIPDDVAAALDDEIAAYPWVAETATGLSLRR